MADAPAAVKGGDLPEVVPGLGEAGGEGAGVPEVHRREGQGLDWSAVVRLIFEKHGRDHQVATVWHPEAQGETLETKLGNVRVLQGPAQYQLTTGEKIEI